MGTKSLRKRRLQPRFHREWFGVEWFRRTRRNNLVRRRWIGRVGWTGVAVVWVCRWRISSFSSFSFGRGLWIWGLFRECRGRGRGGRRLFRRGGLGGRLVVSGMRRWLLLEC